MLSEGSASPETEAHELTGTFDVDKLEQDLFDEEEREYRSSLVEASAQVVEVDEEIPDQEKTQHQTESSEEVASPPSPVSPHQVADPSHDPASTVQEVNTPADRSPELPTSHDALLRKGTSSLKGTSMSSPPSAVQDRHQEQESYHANQDDTNILDQGHEPQSPSSPTMMDVDMEPPVEMLPDTDQTQLDFSSVATSSAKAHGYEWLKPSTQTFTYPDFHFGLDGTTTSKPFVPPPDFEQLVKDTLHDERAELSGQEAQAPSEVALEKDVESDADEEPRKEDLAMEIEAPQASPDAGILLVGPDSLRLDDRAHALDDEEVGFEAEREAEGHRTGGEGLDEGKATAEKPSSIEPSTKELEVERSGLEEADPRDSTLGESKVEVLSAEQPVVEGSDVEDANQQDVDSLPVDAERADTERPAGEDSIAHEDDTAGLAITDLIAKSHPAEAATFDDFVSQEFNMSEVNAEGSSAGLLQFQEIPSEEPEAAETDSSEVVEANPESFQAENTELPAQEQAEAVASYLLDFVDQSSLSADAADATEHEPAASKRTTVIDLVESSDEDVSIPSQEDDKHPLAAQAEAQPVADQETNALHRRVLIDSSASDQEQSAAQSSTAQEGMLGDGLITANGEREDSVDEDATTGDQDLEVLQEIESSSRAHGKLVDAEIEILPPETTAQVSASASNAHNGVQHPMEEASISPTLLLAASPDKVIPTIASPEIGTAEKQSSGDSPALAVQDTRSDSVAETPVASKATRSTRKSISRRKSAGRKSGVHQELKGWFSPRDEVEDDHRANGVGAFLETPISNKLGPENETPISVKPNPVNETPIHKKRAPVIDVDVEDSETEQVDGLHERAEQALKDVKVQPNGGLHTDLSYFSPLKNLHLHLNRSSSQAEPATVDILAVVSSPATKPKRATTGPRDYFTTLHVVEPHGRNASSPTAVQIFRPYKDSLPLAETGDVVLLRSFMVKSAKGESFLLSTASSAWAVWRFGKVGDDDLTDREAQCLGPPVEIGDQERQQVQALRSWWSARSAGVEVNGKTTNGTK